MLPKTRDELIAAALRHAGGSHDVHDVLAMVEAGRLQLWEGAQSLIVTEIVDYPRLRELQFFLAAGNMDEIKTLYPIVLQWGREQQCHRAVFVGRRGWERSFLTREAGWHSPMAVFEKEL